MFATRNGLVCAGKTSCEFMHAYIRNGIDDVNQLNAMISFLEAKCEFHDDPSSWTDQALGEAATAYRTVKRHNDAKILAVDHMLFKTSELDVSQDSPGVVYVRDEFGRRLPASCFGRRGDNTCSGRVSYNARFFNIPFINERNKLMVYEATSGRWEEQIGDWKAKSDDIDSSGMFVYGSDERRLVGVSSTNEMLYRRVEHPPCWLRPQRSLVASAIEEGLVNDL